MKTALALISRPTLLYLGLGLVLYFFSNGNWTVSAAAWLAPVFLLRFLDTVKPAPGLFFLFVLLLVLTYPMLVGIIPPFLGVLAFVLTFYYATLTFLPYAIYRLVEKRNPSLLTTLVFPAVGVTGEYLNTVFWGSWNSLAYTQFGNLPLMQLASLTGIWGITFLILWIAAVVAWIWKHQFAWDRIKTPVAISASLIALVLLYGGLRLRLHIPSSESLKIASFTPTPALTASMVTLKSSPYASSVDWAKHDRAGYGRTLDELHDQVFAANERLLAAGASLYLWPEGAIRVLAENEHIFIGKAAKLAQAAQSHLLVAYYLVPAGDPSRDAQNKSVLINPDGQVEWHYLKSKLVPGSRDKAGDGVIPVSHVSTSRIGTAICYDMDFTGLIHQAGKKNIDVMLVPAWDWEAIDPLHSQMATFRAIENGFSMVRQTGEGLSIAVDPLGRTVAAMDHFHSTDHTMVSQVPKKGVTTLYRYLGDWFAWLSIAGLILLLYASRRAQN